METSELQKRQIDAKLSLSPDLADSGLEAVLLELAKRGDPMPTGRLGVAPDKYTTLHQSRCTK